MLSLKAEQQSINKALFWGHQQMFGRVKRETERERKVLKCHACLTSDRLQCVLSTLNLLSRVSVRGMWECVCVCAIVRACVNLSDYPAGSSSFSQILIGDCQTLFLFCFVVLIFYFCYCFAVIKLVLLILFCYWNSLQFAAHKKMADKADEANL